MIMLLENVADNKCVPCHICVNVFSETCWWMRIGVADSLYEVVLQLGIWIVLIRRRTATSGALL
jgi:hypothetical protein